MCLGTPLQLLEAGEFSALACADGQTVRVDLALVGAQSAGTWVLVFLGAAREVLTPEDAEKIRAAHAALLDVMRFGAADVDRHFPDLAGRMPELPPSLISPPERPE